MPPPPGRFNSQNGSGKSNVQLASNSEGSGGAGEPRSQGPQNSEPSEGDCVWPIRPVDAAILTTQKGKQLHPPYADSGLNTSQVDKQRETSNPEGSGGAGSHEARVLRIPSPVPPGRPAILKALVK